MGVNITNCLQCGGFMREGDKCPTCNPQVVRDAMAATPKSQVEAFDKTLDRADKHEQRCRQWYRSKGFFVAEIPLYKDDDQGVFFIWKTDDEGVKTIRTVDAKMAIEWHGANWPFRKIYITAEKELHRDWIYMITNYEFTHAVIIDMRKHRTSPLTVDETKNLRGVKQRSVGMPIDCVKIREL